MPYSSFSLFNSHLDLAHKHWKEIVDAFGPEQNHLIIDATCGNGHDTLFLAKMALENHRKFRLLAIDKQSKAIQNAQKLLKENVDSDILAGIEFLERCHSKFPDGIAPESVSLIVYNLGYLPGTDKMVTTMSETTLLSLQNALQLVRPGGLISMTCYPGHSEGAVEEKRILEFASGLSPSVWSCCHHRWLNRKAAPSLLLMAKKT